MLEYSGSKTPSGPSAGDDTDLGASTLPPELLEVIIRQCPRSTLWRCCFVSRMFYRITVVHLYSNPFDEDLGRNYYRSNPEIVERCQNLCRTLSENPDLAGLVRTFRTYFWDNCSINVEQIREARFPNVDTVHLTGHPDRFILLLPSTQLRVIHTRLLQPTQAFTRWTQRQTSLRCLDLYDTIGANDDIPGLALLELQSLTAMYDPARRILLNSPAVVELEVHLDRDVSELIELLRPRSPGIYKLEIHFVRTELSESDLTSIRNLPDLQDLHIAGMCDPEEEPLAVLHTIARTCSKLRSFKWTARYLNYDRYDIDEYVYRYTLVNGQWKIRYAES
ncbi:hypothetical protein FRB94_001433 [Tulasnella sp. JGI-2019a]|nr:hypothetical protein FRB94_001433 [Tulasnella sp. JGI-2019a]KAG9006281.1 hypothetical protein FRB93_008770 [Tulasnella sp. JGI-2019a]KAG9037948.1 hypothetical protein FRB95_003341 [Tulasnella sp. JGI-2019a]